VVIFTEIVFSQQIIVLTRIISHKMKNIENIKFELQTRHLANLIIVNSGYGQKQTIFITYLSNKPQIRNINIVLARFCCRYTFI